MTESIPVDDAGFVVLVGTSSLSSSSRVSGSPFLFLEEVDLEAIGRGLEMARQLRGKRRSKCTDALFGHLGRPGREEAGEGLPAGDGEVVQISIPGCCL